MANNPNRVERVHRSVIENKLLTSLRNSNNVALLVTEEDLGDIIFSLEAYDGSMDRQVRCREFAQSLRQLMREAYPHNQTNKHR